MTITRTAAYGIAAIRAGIGATFMANPGSITRAYAATSGADEGGNHLLARSLGVRDLLLGVGLHRALRRGHGATEWMVYGSVSEAVDLTALVLHEGGRGRTRPALVAAIAGAALGDVVLAAALHRQER